MAIPRKQYKDKNVEKSTNYRKITFVIAPEIPYSALDDLKLRWKEAMVDPTDLVVTNYEVYVDTVSYDPENNFLKVAAPGIPLEEVRKLKKQIDKALRKKDAIVFVNYNLHIQLMSSSGTVI